MVLTDAIFHSEYKYIYTNDEKLITNVRKILVGDHTPNNTSLMHTYMINKVKACGIICDRKGKHVNWCIFVEWTIRDQLQRLHALEADQSKPSSSLDLSATSFLDVLENPKGKLEDQKDDFPRGIMPKPNFKCGIQGCMTKMQVQSIEEWEDHIFFIEKRCQL